MAKKRSTGPVPGARGALRLVALAIAFGALVVATTGCGGASSSGGSSAAGQAAGRAGVMSVAEAKTFLDQHPEALVLDVREPSEWNDDLGHMERARLIPSGDLGARVSEIAEFKDKPVLVVCRVGMRSHYAAQFLAGQGFSNVSNLNGGMDAWRKAGY